MPLTIDLSVDDDKISEIDLTNEGTESMSHDQRSANQNSFHNASDTEVPTLIVEESDDGEVVENDPGDEEGDQEEGEITSSDDSTAEDGEDDESSSLSSDDDPVPPPGQHKLAVCKLAVLALWL